MENSIKNSIVAIVFRGLQILLPFITRTMVIKMLGLSYVGISGLFTSIFGLLGIAELGVGSAMLHALYAPIENKETNRINAIINFYKKAYWIIGIVILAFGLMLMPFLKVLIKEGTYPAKLNLYYIYLVNLCSTVSSYLIYSYKALLLEAHQLGREVNKVKIWMTFISYTVQIAILVWTKNYYMYVTMVPVTTIASAVWVGKVSDRFFPQCKPVGNVAHEERKIIFKDIKALFMYKIGGVIFNSVDNIVISWWFGAVVLGRYNNYYFVVSTVSTMILVVYNAVLPSLGSSVVGSSVEKNYKDFMHVAFLDGWINGWCSICLYCLLPTFINLWIGDEGSLGKEYALLFAIYFFCWRILDPVSIYKDSLGLWSMDKWRPLLTASFNLILNISLTLTIGLYGILISSIVAVLVISYPFSVKYLFQYFDRSSKQYFLQMFNVIFFTIVAGAVTKMFCISINTGKSRIDLIIMCFICIIVPNFLCLIVFWNHEGIQIIKQKLTDMRRK